MANYIENQPVFLGTTDTCSNDVDFIYNQLVDVTDTTQFQLSIAPCISAENLIVNPNFETDSDWTTGDNVGIADDLLCFTGETIAGVSGSYANSTSVFNDGKYYQVNITIDSIVGEFEVYLESQLLGTFNSIGTHTFYGMADFLLSTGYLVICPVTDGAIACISNVTSFELLTNFIVGIFDTSNNEVARISYNDNSGYFTFVKDSVTISIDWSELSITSGCHYLCIADPCVNTGGQNYPPSITNGNFASGDTGWVVGSKWVVTAGGLVGTYSGGGGKADYEVTQSNVFNNYTNTYCVSIECTSGSGTIKVYFGETLIATENIANGNTYQFTGLAYGNGSLIIVLSSGTFTIDNISACTIFDELQCDFTSNMFKIADYSNECTLLVNACNNEDGLGFVFDGSGFSPRLRLNAKLKEPKYNNERFTYTDSKGKKQVYWFKGRKQKYFCTDLEPEYILDYLWSLFGYDNIYIEDELYVVDDDEFNPTYSFDNVGSVKFLVSKKEQNIINANCSSEENNCVIGENYLLKADNNSEFVTLTDGSYILIN